MGTGDQGLNFGYLRADDEDDRSLLDRDREIARLRNELAAKTRELELKHNDLMVLLRKEDLRKAEQHAERCKERNRVWNELDKTPTAHLDRFFAHACADKLVGLFPNAKEVTESVAAFHAVNTHLAPSRSTRSVWAVVVGDGHSPRTGAYVALSTNWEVVSVDPVLRRKKAYESLSPRLWLVPDKVENMPGVYRPYDHVIVIAVHSHATLEAVLRRVRQCARLDVVSIPCCVPQYVPWDVFSEEEPALRDNTNHGQFMPPDVRYEDPAILSPERTVLVWKDVKQRAHNEARRRLAAGL